MINDFYDSFTAEIRQIAVNDRMKITCMKEKFIKIITYHDAETFKKKELKITNEIFKVMIRNIFMWAKKRRSDNLVTVLFWLKTGNSTLNISQHCRIMLIKINKRIKIIKKNADKKVENFLSEINHKIDCIYLLIWVESLI